ncbi:Hypothetical predicted protein [Pelobates cultripes]|uniref:Uncharacterized protein n=1 Tax=Pelobates cultripes TaxID=61616 RepID=A0AAD1WU88_PELCU|nr:Hypothetical predicted protein [Pelobates cultripes]
MAPKMAAPPERTPDPLDPQTGAGSEPSTTPQATGKPASRDTLTPATKQDIADLLMEMRQMHAADLDLNGTEMLADQKSQTSTDGCPARFHHQVPFRDGQNQAPRGTFEASQVTFYQDLTRNTLLWRRSLAPVTTQLRDAKIDYKWTLPMSLTVTKEGATLSLSSLQEAELFLRALGIPTRAQTWENPMTSHTWDPERITPFTPRDTERRGP